MVDFQGFLRNCSYHIQKNINFFCILYLYFVFLPNPYKFHFLSCFSVLPKPSVKAK